MIDETIGIITNSGVTKIRNIEFMIRIYLISDLMTFKSSIEQGE